MNEEILDKALTEIHRRAHNAYLRTEIYAFREIAETAWAALAYGRPPDDSEPPRLTDCTHAVCSCSSSALPQCPRR